MSSCTIVSVIPWNLNEEKPGQFPPTYVIAGARKKGEIGITHVNDGYYVELIPNIDEYKQREIPILASNITRGIVEDFIRAQLATTFDTFDTELGKAQALPGIFGVENDYDVAGIRKSFPGKLLQAELNQTVWFGRLVTIADDDWARYHRHNVISDIQRVACKWLGLEREWNFNPLEKKENTLCKGCMSAVHPNAVICAVCKTVLDEARYAKLKIAV